MWILQSPETTFRLKSGAVKTVGRAPRADFILDVALVSRLHCRLTAADDQLEVVDLKSTNGTFVNDKRIADEELLPRRPFLPNLQADPARAVTRRVMHARFAGAERDHLPRRVEHVDRRLRLDRQAEQRAHLHDALVQEQVVAMEVHR